MKQLRHADAESPLFALNFVADAWRDFCDKILELSGQGIMHPNSPYANLKAKKAFRSLTTEYHTHMTGRVYPIFANTYLKSFNSEDKKLVDFGSFLSVFGNFAEMVVNDGAPLTFSGFIESNLCSPFNSGLVIDTSDDDHANDFIKCSKYLIDENFDLVKAIASHYGFAMDKNAPWRFVADVRSPVMQEYMVGVELVEFPIDNENPTDDCDNPLVKPGFPRWDPYGFSQVPGLEDVIRHAFGYNEYSSLRDSPSVKKVFDTLFSTAYSESWRTDMDIVKIYLLDFYNATVATQPAISVYIEPKGGLCDRGRTELIERQPVDFQSFIAQSAFGDKWNLKSYYLLRRMERKLKEPNNLVSKNLKDLINVYNFAAPTQQRDLRYVSALRYLQEEIIGPLTMNNLTIDTIGDIVNK